MNIYGYARASHLEPEGTLAQQVGLLEAAGCLAVYQDMADPLAQAERTQWQALCERVGEGDCVLVAKIDRAAASLSHLAAVLGQVCERGATLCVMSPVRTPAQEVSTLAMSLPMVEVWQEFERDLVAERKRIGIAAGRHLQR